MSGVMEQKVPEGYKQTEVGVIPEDWELVTLYSLAEKIMVGIASAATHAYRDRGIPLLRNQNIKPNYLDDEDVLFVTEEYEELFKNKRLKTGDLVTARTGYPGTTCLIPDKYEAAQSFTTLITRLKIGKSIPEYICFYMNSEAGEKFFELNQIGGGQKNVNAAILRNMPFPLPSQKEQTVIANALSDVDALITSLEKLIAKKCAIKTAAMQQLLTGKKRLPPFDKNDNTFSANSASANTSAAHAFAVNEAPAPYNPQDKNPKGARKGYKQTELGEIPEDWEVKSLAELCSLKSGSTITAASIDDSSRYPCYGGNGLRGYAKIFTHDGEYALIGRQGALCGNVQYLNDVFFASEHALVASPAKTTNVKWLAIYLKRMNLNQYSESSAQPGLSAVKLGVLKLISPGEKEQEAIAYVLSDMDVEVNALSQRLNKIQKIKQGMMQELLTGRTRLVQRSEGA